MDLSKKISLIKFLLFYFYNFFRPLYLHQRKEAADACPNGLLFCTKNLEKIGEMQISSNYFVLTYLNRVFQYLVC